MYCKNCGKEMSAEAKYCENCGVAVKEQNDASPIKAQLSKFNKKVIIAIIISVFVSIAAIVCVIFALGEGTGYNMPEKAAKNFVIAFETGDAELLLDSIPDFFIRRMMQSSGISDKKELIKLMKSEVHSTVSCVVKNAVLNTDSWLLSEYKEDMTYYGATYEEISKIKNYCIIDVSALVDEREREYIVFCVQYDGRWYAVDID